MRLVGRFGPRPRIGLALGPDAVVARLLGAAARPERVELPVEGEADGGGGAVGAGPADGPDGDVLTRALAALAADLERTHGREVDGADVFIALLPPRVDVRMIDLPPLKPAEAEAVVRRDQARHFLGSERTRTVGVRGDRPAAGDQVPPDLPPAFAAAAPAALLDALVDAAGEVGWRVRTIGPAHSAWLRAGVDGLEGGDPPAFVAAVIDQTAHLLGVRERAPVSLRRVPLERVDELGPVVGPGPVAVVGDTGGADAVAADLRRRGATVGRAWPDEDAAGLAARFAEGATPRLAPPSLEARVRERSREQLVRSIGAAAVLVLLAVGLHYLNLRRELASLQDERMALRAEVAPLVAARDSLFRLNEEVTTIGTVAGQSHGWTRALAELAYLLPRETYLTSLTGNEGLLEFEAAGQRAGEALEALRAATTLHDVRLVGLVERELENGETVVERFRLSARIDAPLAPSQGGEP